MNGYRNSTARYSEENDIIPTRSLDSPRWDDDAVSDNYDNTSPVTQVDVKPQVSEKLSALFQALPPAIIER